MATEKTEDLFDDWDAEMFDDDIEEKEVEEEPEEKEDAPKKKRGKLDKDGSKKNKTAKNKKGTLKKIIVGSLVLCISVSSIAALIGINTQKNDNSPNTPYKMTITLDDDETWLLGNVDLGYFYIYNNNGKYELVRTSPRDNYIHYAYDNSIIEGLNIHSDKLTPLSSSKIIENISTNGKVEKEGILGNEYNITIRQSDLDSLLKSPTCDDEVKTYNDSNGNVYNDLSDFLDAASSKGKSK